MAKFWKTRTSEPQAPGPRRLATRSGRVGGEVRHYRGAKGWDELCVQVAANTRRAFELVRSDPRPPEDKTHYRLRGSLASREFGDGHWNSGRSR